MLRGPGATPAAKRTQRACRPRDWESPDRRGVRSRPAESTSLRRRKTTSPVLKWPGWIGGPPGSESGACTQGSSRNLGLVFSTVERRRGRRYGRSSPSAGERDATVLARMRDRRVKADEALSGKRPALRERRGRSGGSAERRKRSDARREARSRSRLIVCAGQRPDRVGSSPTGARVRGAISKGGGNASPAG